MPEKATLWEMQKPEGKGQKGRAKPPKATTRPYTRHILGIDSGVQSHPKATPRLHQGYTKAPHVGLSRFPGGVGGSAVAQDTGNQHDSGKSDAGPAEPVAVLVVIGRDALLSEGEQGDLDGQVAGAIDGAAVVAKDLAQSAMGVRPAGDAVVGASDERETVLDGAEHGGCGVLPLGGAFAKPTVVGEVHQEIDVVVGGFTAKVGEDVLKADQGRGSRVRVGQDER